jgi:hypothetical protein
MKQHYVGLLLLLGLLAAGETRNAVAQDQKFTCQAYGGSFVLDGLDFKALAESDSKITREKFGSLDANTRKQACDSRKFWRLIQAGKADPCDFLVGGHYHWLPDMFASADEQSKLIDAQLDAMNKREASAQKLPPLKYKTR